MRKERIKTVILTLLILNCLQLTGQIWLNRKLWPSGYNFFNSVSNNPVVESILRVFPFGKESGTVDNGFINIIRPQQIVISSGNAREVYLPGGKQYSDAYKTVDSVMRRLLESSTVRSSVISAEEWQGYLKGKSIYIDYGINMDSASLMASFGAIRGTVLSGVGAVSDIMITGDNVTKEGIVCIFDSASDTITKYWVDFRGDELLKYIESATFGKRQNKAFAFELGLDRPPAGAGTAIKRRILLSPLVLLSMNSETMEKISVSNPLEGAGGRFDSIVEAFGYTPSSLRKSVTEEGVASYVENSATIRINTNGMVEYAAVETDKGILLQSGRIEPTSLINGITRIAAEVWRAAGGEDFPDLCMASDLTESRDGEYIVKMNYSFNGIPVITPVTDEDFAQNAIYAQVQNGYLKRFKILLRSFEPIEESSAVMPGINALDSLAIKYKGAESVRILDIFKCYNAGDETASVVWGVKISGENDTVLVD